MRIKWVLKNNWIYLSISWGVTSWGIALISTSRGIAWTKAPDNNKMLHRTNAGDAMFSLLSNRRWQRYSNKSTWNVALLAPFILKKHNSFISRGSRNLMKKTHINCHNRHWRNWSNWSNLKNKICLFWNQFIRAIRSKQCESFECCYSMADIIF